MTYRIGITGCIGSGKSTVGDYLQTKQIPVLDTDMVVHELYQDPSVVEAIASQFGAVCVDKRAATDDACAKVVNRQQLGAIVFQDAAKRHALEKLIHPLVRARTAVFLQAGPEPVRVVLVPLLFESGSEGLYDETWAITVTPQSELIQRLQKRHPDWSIEQIMARLAAQWPQEEKAARASVVLHNDSSPEALLAQVDARLKLLDIQHQEGAQA